MLKGKPFVKWAGGKRSIIDKLIKLAPHEFDTYYEPFVGGGAMLFELSPKKAVINDSNEELINVYNCLKDEKKFTLLCNELNKHERNHSEEYYYQVRNMDRDKKKYSKLSDYKKASRTIYLNKACFNGLYRVNSKGEFNVPFGKKNKINTYDGINLGIIYSYLNLNDIKILSIDFYDAVKNAKKGDFIYFDPPYDSETEIFTSYTSDGFDRKCQERLAETFKELDKRGCYVMLSNYNTNLIKDLYKGYNFYYTSTKRNIGAKAKDRKEVLEVIITNYKNIDTFE